MSKTFGPYQPVRQAGDTYYVSGQGGVDFETKIASPDIEGQTHQAMDNLRTLLGENGLTLQHLVKVTIYLTNMDNFDTVNEIYASYLGDGEKPTRSCVGVSELPDVAAEHTPLLILLDAIAHKGQDG